MIPEILHELEAQKVEMARITIESGTLDKFEYNRGAYHGVDHAINIIKKMAADKGREDDDL